MKGLFSEGLIKNERAHDYQRSRLKTSPGGQSMNDLPKKMNQETIMIFGFQQYPFPNDQNLQTPMLKTIVNLDLTTEKLQKVIKLTHPNIIGLRKIVRSSPRQAYEGSRQRSYYSFYYEVVHYNLRDLFEDPNKNIRLFNQIKSYNLRQILVNVTEYLKQAGIFYVSRLEDIGVHLDGTIKIYIPPNTVFQSNYNPNIHRAILAINEWWENAQPHVNGSKFKKDKKVFQLQPPRLSDNGDLQLDEPSMKSSTLQRQLGQLLDDDDQAPNQQQDTTKLKQSTNSHYSELTKLGSIQLQKLKKIDEQVKFIRSRLNDKTKRKHKQSDHTQEKRQIGKSKSSLNLFDSQQISKTKEKTEDFQKVEPNFFAREPIQQNIHCINIYNHNGNSPIAPNVFPNIPNQKYMQKNKNYQVYYDPRNIDPEFFRDQDEQYSQDTYDIEFQNQFQMPNNQPVNSYRHTLVAPHERQLSEYSQHCHKKNRDGWNELKSKPKQQAVQMCNKNVTQSAGPLQFKSFVNKIIKPQFAGKKSHIFEDPGEDAEQQSQKQVQIKKKEEVVPMKKTPTATSNTSFRHHSTDKGLNQIKRISNKSVVQQNKKPQIKRINSQHDFNIRKKLLSNDGQIQQKVKKALQKTKNAIALLNRVKSSKGNIKPMSSQQN